MPMPPSPYTVAVGISIFPNFYLLLASNSFLTNSVLGINIKTFCIQEIVFKPSTVKLNQVSIRINSNTGIVSKTSWDMCPF